MPDIMMKLPLDILNLLRKTLLRGIKIGIISITEKLGTTPLNALVLKMRLKP